MEKTSTLRSRKIFWVLGKFVGHLINSSSNYKAVLLPSNLTFHFKLNDSIGSFFRCAFRRLFINRIMGYVNA